MNMDIKDGAIGSEGSYDIDLEAGDLVFKVAHGSKGVSAGVEVRIKADYFLDKLAEKIPGEVDDAIFAVLKGALKA
jgi:hypothetical protein